MIEFIHLWKRPITGITRMVFREEDSIKSRACPIYMKPIKEGFYMSFTEAVTFEWLGGKNLKVSSPSWWEESYKNGKKDWYLSSLEELDEPCKFRYVGESPVGSPEFKTAHSSGLTVNVFNGWSIKTPLGMKCYVTRPFNNFNPVVTVQDGIYDTDLFAGDFSFNLQFMQTGCPVTFQAGEPVVGMYFFEETKNPNFSVRVFDTPESVAQREKAKEFYVRKTTTGCPYHRNLQQGLHE
jgi:hypothetical protein